MTHRFSDVAKPVSVCPYALKTLYDVFHHMVEQCLRRRKLHHGAALIAAGTGGAGYSASVEIDGRVPSRLIALYRRYK